MGYRQLINNAIDTAFAAIGDIAEDATYQHVASETLDPTTLQKTENVVEYSVKVVRSSFSLNEIDGAAILPSDVKFIIKATSLDFDPTPKDKIVHNGTVYDVVRHLAPAVPATITVQARA